MEDIIAPHELYFRLIIESSPKLIKGIIIEGPHSLLHAICCCAHNVIDRRIPVNARELKELKANRKIIYQISNHRQSVSSKRKQLVQDHRTLNAVKLLIRLVLQALDNSMIY